MIGRRLLLKGTAIMTGDGLVRPINAPPGGQLTPGVQPGASSPVVSAARVVVIGPDGSVISLIPGSPVKILLGTGDPAEGTPGTLGAVIDGAGVTRALFVQLQSPVFTGIGGAALLRLESASADGTTSQPVMIATVADIAGVSDLQLIMQPTRLRVQDNLGNIPLDINPTVLAGFQNITLDAGWTASTPVPQVRLLPDGNVQLTGVATHASITAPTTVNLGVPLAAAYRPATTKSYKPNNPIDAAAAVAVTSAGVITARANATFPATSINLEGIYSLT